MRVELDPDALDAMSRARAVADRAIAAGTPAYGVTTGVGSHKSFPVEASASGHDRLLVRQHLIAQGPPVPHDVVRATALRLANALASATTVARPELAEHLVAALNDDRLPTIRAHGSVGQSDLAQMADLAEGILGGFELACGERSPAQPECALDGLRITRVRRRGDAPRCARSRRCARPRGARRQSRCASSSDRRRSSLPRAAGHARPCAGLARR